MSAASAARAYDEAVAYVTGLVRAEPSSVAERERIGLTPVRGLLDALGNPERALACVHLAGSKGKGSTALLCEQLMRAAGRSVGTYTSPHLVAWTERIRIDGRPVSERGFADAILAVRSAARASTGPAPSFFDVLTAAALLEIARAGVDVAILETGLGGRLDATNAIAHPRATCITTIELEHADRLGGTLGAIAREKAGIVKPGAPLVIGRLGDEARGVVEDRARALAAPVWSLADRGTIDPRAGGGWRITLSVDTGAITFDVGHPSAVVAENAALAAACASVSGILARAALETGAAALERCRVPGRLDVLGRAPLRVVDGAHTVESVARLVELLDALDAPPLDLVVSVTRGKDARALLAPLLARAARVHVTTAEPTRSIPAQELAATLRELRPALPIRVIDEPRAALRAALAETSPDGALCATGSLYLAGAALDALDAPKR